MLEKPGPSIARDPLHLSASLTPDMSELVGSEGKLTIREQPDAEGDSRVVDCVDCIRLAADLRSASERSDASAVTDCRVLIRRHVAECARREFDGHD